MQWDELDFPLLAEDEMYESGWELPTLAEIAMEDEEYDYDEEEFMSLAESGTITEAES